MKKSIKLLTLATLGASALYFSGCSSILNGTRQTVSFNSNPPGAKLYINGMQVGKTPYVCEVHRGDNPEVVMRKEGYEDEKYTMTDSVDGVKYFLGNGGLCLLWIVPGVVGFIVDPITGAMWEYDYPNVNLELTPKKALTETPVRKTYTKRPVKTSSNKKQ